MKQIPLGVYAAEIHVHLREVQILTSQSTTGRNNEMLSRTLLRLLLVGKPGTGVEQRVRGPLILTVLKGEWKC